MPSFPISPLSDLARRIRSWGYPALQARELAQIMEGRSTGDVKITDEEGRVIPRRFVDPRAITEREEQK